MRHLRGFRSASAWGPLIRVAPLLWIALIAVGVDLVVSRRVEPESVLFLACVFVGHLIGRVLTTLALERRWSMPGALTAAVAASGLLVATQAESVASWFDPMLAIALVGLSAIGFTVVDLWLPAKRVRNARRDRVRVSPLDISRMRIAESRDGAGLVLDGLPGSGVIEGAAATDVLIYSAAELWGHVGREAVEAGWVLARSSGSLGRLVRALDAIRPEAKGKQAWSDLPTAWKVAFYLCAVEAASQPGARDDLLERIRAESEVAAIAEELDSELGSRSE